eukprot:m.174246 g.174246  ORF g.174246 m.174246 type:complete len:344 (+) comp39109_c0_seq3:132-1163(+)
MGDLEIPDWILRALSTDCQSLLAAYHKKQSLRFSDFATVWSDMKFGLLFRLASTQRKITRKLIVEGLLQIFVQFFSSSSGHVLLVRVGAVYALYSVYSTQSVPEQVKIRVTESVWKELDSFQELMHKDTHFDVEYVIRVLKMKRAFYYTAMPCQASFFYCMLHTFVLYCCVLQLVLGSQVHFSGSLESDAISPYPYFNHDVVKSIWDSSSLEKLKERESAYVSSKMEFLANHSRLTPALTVSIADLASDLQKFLQQLSEKKEKCPKAKVAKKGKQDEDTVDPATAEISVTQTETSVDESSSVLTRRQEIKRRAFQASTEKKRRRNFSRPDSPTGSSSKKMALS